MLSLQSTRYNPVARIEDIVREIYGLNPQKHRAQDTSSGSGPLGYRKRVRPGPREDACGECRSRREDRGRSGGRRRHPGLPKAGVHVPRFVRGSSRPAAIQQILELQQAFIAAGLSDVWYKRFLASTATTNDAKFMENYIQNTFPASGDFSKGSGLPLFLSEYGANGLDACLFYRHEVPACSAPAQQELRDRSQRDYNAAEFRVAMALDTTPTTSKTGYFYGFSIFQWQDAFWKCPPENPYCTDGQFGVQKRASPLTQGTIGGGRCGIPVNKFKYPVVNLQPKLAWDPTVQAFAP
jgi:hypothetical protein